MTFNYDFSETQDLGDFVTLTPGRYIFAVAGVKKGTSNSGKPKAVVTLRVVAGNPAYIDGVISQNWPVTGAGAFRFKALLKALGVKPNDKGKVALEKYIDHEFGASVSLKPGDEPNDAGETIYFHELARIANVKQYEDLLEEEWDDEDEDEEIEEEEAEEEDDDEVEEDDEEVETVNVEDLDEMDLSELKELAEEWDVSTKPDKGKKKLTAAQMRKRLAALIEEADEDDEEEDDEEAVSELPSAEDLDDMKLSELKELAEEHDVALPKVPKGKKLTAAKVRKALLDNLYESDEDDDDEEPF